MQVKTSGQGLSHRRSVLHAKAQRLPVNMCGSIARLELAAQHT